MFQALPGMTALLTPDLRYADANRQYLRSAGRSREQVIGRYLFDVFPDNPDDPNATGTRNLAASLQRVLDTGERDTMAVQRYDVESPERPGHWDERYWSPVNVPVLDADGKVVLVLHRVEEVTALVQARAAEGDRLAVLEAELQTRARELQEANEHLRLAHAGERQVALALQEAMLPPPHLGLHHPVAVRYRPAVDQLNVCGDWYDLIDLSADRVAVSVGDVVGHGLAAAGVMGQLRSALSAASRVSAGPAQALDVLDTYARSVPGGENATAVSVIVDWEDNTLVYSTAGHPPAILVDADGSVRLLDAATDPPLGASPEHRARHQSAVTFTEDAVLLLYTDGLIERRGEDIDVGLARLVESAARHRRDSPARLADRLLGELLPSATDDTAVVVLRL
ncbi:hypothetical protein GCM10009838_10560 [Catenulispora subtropica]|uniref:PPM-type phosphatase domain-containing protein n=1 Tax=Catenulispora subtropica TaxID=450798 RepID=A0ABN2QQV7_9ACTN